MRNLALVILSVSFLIGCSKNKEAGEAVEIVDEKQLEQTVDKAVKKTAEKIEMESHPILGYWVSDDNSYILKIDKQSTQFTFLSRGASKNPEGSKCNNVTLNEEKVVLNCRLTKDLDFGMVLNEAGQLVSTRQDMPGHLNPMPNLSIKELTATWTDKESNGKRSTIYVTNQREDGYALETFDIYEQEKKYYYSKKQYKNTFSNGFKFTEQLEASESVFYIVEFNQDWYRAVDQTGYSWISKKYEGDMNNDLQEQGYQLIK